MSWISVKDELPDYDEYCFWYREDGICFAEMLDKDGSDWLCWEEPKITHWQPIVPPDDAPLPEPPKQ